MKQRIFIVLTMALLAIVIMPHMVATYARVHPQIPNRYTLHMVKKGETIWGIGQQYLPDVDPRLAEEWIKTVNGMPTSYQIQPYDIINVPTADGELDEPLGSEYSSSEAAKKAEALVDRIRREAIQRPAARAMTYRELVMEATAYTAGPESTGKVPGDPEYGITFTGLQADRGVVAVDPQVIKLGSVLWVEGYGYALAADTGRVIKGNKIDVFFHDVNQANRWGRKQVRVRVIE